MERQLYYNKVLPLEEFTLRTVVRYLWNGSIFDPVEKLRDVWDVFEGDVKEKVSNLKLPKLIRNRMMNLVKPIGSDILNWQVFHENNFVYACEVFNLHILRHLQRTYSARIDYRRTAEELVRHDLFDVTKCFELACLYCLEDIIPLLWGKFSEKDKANFLKNVSVSVDVVRSYWAYTLTGDECFLNRFLIRQAEPSSFHYVAFIYSARKGNKSGTEYFFQKLTEKEREYSSMLKIVRILKFERFNTIRRTSLYFSAERVSDVFCYLFSTMTSEQQILVIEKYAFALLLCLLGWQLESIFCDIIDLCWSFLPAEKHGNLLSSIRKVIIRSGYFVPNIFQSFFRRSPLDFRKHFVERECRQHNCRSLFAEFLRAEDIETLKTIFKNIGATEKVNIVLSKPVCKILIHFILSGRWQVVEVCILAAELSTENMQNLELSLRYLVVNLSRGIPNEWKIQKLNGFFEFLSKNAGEF